MKFGLVSQCLSPVGATRNFIRLCERGFTFRTLPFVMGFYFALLCPNKCLGSVLLLFKPA